MKCTARRHPQISGQSVWSDLNNRITSFASRQACAFLPVNLLEFVYLPPRVYKGVLTSLARISWGQV